MWKILGSAMFAIFVAAVPVEAQDVDDDVMPDSIMAELKAQAAEDWPADFTTQKYWIEQQVKAYAWLKAYDPEGVPEDVLISVRERAAADWPTDYTTQKYWIEQQVKAYLELQ